MQRLHRPGVIDRAVASVPIWRVLASLGVPVEGPPPPGTSLKIWCPFSDLHPDGGRDREMRLYTDNKAYCHVCVRQYDSVSLAAAAWGCSALTAAERLVAGHEAHDQAQMSRSMYVLRSGAVAALGEWADAHDVDRFSPEYRRCLDLADHITEADHVAKWITACKMFLSPRVGLNHGQV